MSGKETEASSSGQNEQTSPSQYSSLPEAVAADMHSLSVGDLNEVITVPMVHSTEASRLRDAFIPFGGKRGKVTQTVIVRKMTRERYLKHYAKDSQGNYVGTEKPAVDAGLVFVPSQSSSEEMLKQVRKVAFGKEHEQAGFQIGYAMEYAGGYNK